MATTMDSAQVGMAADEEVEMMLVDSANAEDDDGEEIKVDDELDDDMDDEDELTDDDDDDVVSTSGRQTPNHHHHHGHHYHEPRVQQHHHHHFHYFYQYPSTATVNSADGAQQYAGSDAHEMPTTGVNTSSMNDAGSAGLVRTISNGSMFGPINANLVPNMLPNGRYPTPSHLISLNQGVSNNSNHHINNNPHAPTPGHYYGPVTPTIYENVPVQSASEQQMNPLVQQLQSQQHLLHQQRQQHNQLLAQQRHFRPKPTTPEVANCISAPVSPSVSIGSPQPTTVQSSSASSSSPSTSGPSSPILSVSASTRSQTVISNPSSGAPTTSTIANNNNPDSGNNNSPNTCVTYHSYPEQASAQASSPSRSPGADDSKNQPTAAAFQPQSPQQIQANSPQPAVPQPQQQSPTPLVSTASPVSSLPTIVLPYTFGRSYQLTSQIEASNLYLCVDTVSQQEFCCKVVNSSKYSKFLGPHMRMDGHEGINQIQKVIFEQHFTFVLFERSFGDLHSYVRNKRRLRENEAQTLFQQILQIVADCHHNGIVLRDLKLRKFIFANEEKTKLKLETLEGASIFEGDNDILTDKHGCPAYVSPEILYSNSYSGMAADCWSMGVILYTMLVGRYPFHDLNPSIVFVKIRRGTYDIPETLSKQARCLIRNLIRLEPEHRLTANDALAHRWFQEKWNLNTKERIIQQHISNLHSFQHQQFLFQHSLSDLTLGPPPRAILTPSLIEGLLQLSDDQVVPTF